MCAAWIFTESPDAPRGGRVARRGEGPGQVRLALRVVGADRAIGSEVDGGRVPVFDDLVDPRHVLERLLTNLSERRVAPRAHRSVTEIVQRVLGVVAGGVH